MSVDLHDIKSARDRMLELAHAMLKGECSYIEGSREIIRLFERARIDGFEKPFVTFKGINSETLDVPFGWLRDTWQAAAKARLEPEWAQSQQWAKTLGEPACRDVITWFAAHPSNWYDENWLP